ncbi:MAG TPA: sulfite exporter TauE/SafE family protein, partial [Thermotoga sp.]|nr:sulfite exporter TauE/SafE family protein [Thermotoga sp.]
MFILVFFAGAIAGFLNVVAGGGSMITLPMLTTLGMGIDVANGTNR